MAGIRYLGTACAALSCAFFASPEEARAQAAPQEAHAPSPNTAAGTELWLSTDSEGTQVVKLAGRALWNFEGKDDYAGIVVERAWFTPATGEQREFSRAYLDLANKLNEDWRWRARVGTDGQTVLGTAEIRRADWSQSVFIERDIIETEQGLNRRIYYTFAGASSDIVIDESNTVAVSGGLQEFSGKNERLHLRGRYVHALKALPGLSAQMDLRYYHSTEPNEFDYFSPENFIRAMPILQLRRFDNDGWMYLIAGGYGAQNSTGSDWQPARFFQFRLESPRSLRKLDAFADVSYSNDSLVGGLNYDYVQGRLGVTVGF